MLSKFLEPIRLLLNAINKILRAVDNKYALYALQSILFAAGVAHIVLLSVHNIADELREEFDNYKRLDNLVDDVQESLSKHDSIHVSRVQHFYVTHPNAIMSEEDELRVTVLQEAVAEGVVRTKEAFQNEPLSGGLKRAVVKVMSTPSYRGRFLYTRNIAESELSYNERIMLQTLNVHSSVTYYVQAIVYQERNWYGLTWGTPSQYRTHFLLIGFETIDPAKHDRVIFQKIRSARDRIRNIIK